MCSENYICTLFEHKADSDLKEISVRGNTMSPMMLVQKKRARVMQRQTSVMLL